MCLEQEILRRMYRRYCPEVLKSVILIKRRAPIWSRAGLIFIHVPKNGGTSINQALYGQFMGHYTIADVARWKPDLYATLPSLALTRNPWARVLSAYRFARAGRSMTEGAQISHPERYQTSEFETFENFVNDWLDGRDLMREDNVFRPQCAFMMAREGEIGVSHVGRLEDPKSYTGFLEDVLGRHLEIEHLNRTAQTEEYRKAFTPEMRDIVARAYAEDIERFTHDF